MSQGTLLVNHLAKTYVFPRGRVTALADVSFRATAGEFVALVGPSGCGKSTLLRLLGGQLAPEQGAIELSGWLRPPKRRIVFQEHSLFPWMPVLDNVAFGLEMEGASQQERRARAMARTMPRVGRKAMFPCAGIIWRTI